MSKSVKHVMRSGVIACQSDLPIGEVTKRLLEHQLHAVFVEGHDGAIMGVISDMDLLAGEWLYTDEESLAVMRSITATELMSSPVSSVSADESLMKTAARMAEEHIHRLLVVEEGRPVGVISVSDIVAALGRQIVDRRTVHEVMSQAIVVCREEAPLHAIARGMSERHTRSIVVVGENGEPGGIITGTDLLRFADSEAGLDELTAADMMHEPVTIRADASLREASDIMITRHKHRLLVVKSGKPHRIPLGLVSTSDILVEMAQPGSVWQPRSGGGPSRS